MKYLLLGLAALSLAGCGKVPSYIAVLNNTGHDLENVNIGTNSFGALKAGAMSTFQAVSRASADPLVHAEGETHAWNLRGSDLPLERGRYIYSLSLGSTNSHRLEVRCLKPRE